MSWLIWCAVIALLLGAGTVAVMNEAMQGIGKTQTWAHALRNPSFWILLAITFAVWLGVCAGVYWLCRGLAALF